MKKGDEQMNGYQIITILLFLGFVFVVLAGISELQSGSVFLSFATILDAIFVLFVAYSYLNDLLTESLKASQ